jgi:hypothetical protein
MQFKHERDCYLIANQQDRMGWNGTKNEIGFENLIGTLFMNSKLELVILFLTVMYDISCSLFLLYK